MAGEAIALLESHLLTRRFRKGELLWREGDTTGMLVSLRAGRVKIYRLGFMGRNQLSHNIPTRPRHPGRIRTRARLPRPAHARNRGRRRS